jgi:hypothetical protein
MIWFGRQFLVKALHQISTIVRQQIKNYKVKYQQVLKNGESTQWEYASDISTAFFGFVSEYF